MVPSIKTENEGFNLNYKLNFLEFYEILLLCANEKAGNIRRGDQIKSKNEKEIGIKTSINRQSLGTPLMVYERVSSRLFRKKRKTKNSSL